MLFRFQPLFNNLQMIDLSTLITVKSGCLLRQFKYENITTNNKFLRLNLRLIKSKNNFAHKFD